MDEIKRIDRTLVANGRVIDYYQDTMLMPDGSTVKWDLIDHVGAAAVVAVREDGKILMVRQYRNPLERQTIEIPAGKLDSRDEDPKKAAERELAEETGYICDDIEYLTTIYTTVAFCNEKIGLFLAKGLKDRHPQHPDDDDHHANGQRNRRQFQDQFPELLFLSLCPQYPDLLQHRVEDEKVW